MITVSPLEESDFGIGNTRRELERQVTGSTESEG